MFTGLVAGLGEVLACERTEEGVRLQVASSLTDDVHEGDSIAVNGVCLTATAVTATGFAAEVMNETLQRSSLENIDAGAKVNLELPLRPADRLGGHIMQGHVDGTGTITALQDDGFARRVQIDAPEDVLRYVVEKGSIAVDGVSLTVAAIDDRSFTVSLIPETLQRTNLGKAQTGDRVNLEVDVLAKYVEKLVRR
ncbi:MAG: riboflavin synthase [Solirubrobacteraceae bacterium]|jgi:riboflavin synthase|nr:riboflavin synthase [Solirubrobacteraceae bacterium]